MRQGEHIEGHPERSEAQDSEADGRCFSPSVARNRSAIRDVFCQRMPSAGRVLEIASGTGEHGAYILEAVPELSWTYSDVDPAALDSQRAWIRRAQTPRLAGPLVLDTRWSDWGIGEQRTPWQGLFCANMIHIAPFSAVHGLFSGAGRVLESGGKLLLYGPFARSGHIAASNAEFDAHLKHRDPDWGVRDLDTQVQPLAEAAGLRLQDVIEMPANNLCVLFCRR